MRPRAALLFVLPALVLAGCLEPASSITSPEPEFHAHADFLVVLDGEAFDFSDERYMETQACPPPGVPHVETSPAHLHDRNGFVVHVHAEGTPWRAFFSHVNFTLSDRCLTVDSGLEHCADEARALRFFVDAGGTGAFESVASLADREIHDLDRVLVLYGPPDEDPAPYFEGVTRDACAYSEKCAPRPGLVITPERCA